MLFASIPISPRMHILPQTLVKELIVLSVVFMHVWQGWCTQWSLKLCQSLFSSIKNVCICTIPDFDFSLFAFPSKHSCTSFEVISDPSLNYALSFQQLLTSISELPFWPWMVMLSSSPFLLTNFLFWNLFVHYLFHYPCALMSLHSLSVTVWHMQFMCQYLYPVLLP